MGTINEAIRKTEEHLRQSSSPRTRYMARQHIALDENSQLGGHDPYSSSKSATEIAVASWRRSFFDSYDASIVTARAGNVIGGGDWAIDRIIPDIVRSFHHQDATGS